MKRHITHLDNSVNSTEESIPTILSKIYLYYLTADENQILGKRTKSLKYIRIRYHQNPQQAAELIQENLEDLYKDYFDTVEVKVEVSGEERYNLAIAVRATRDGKNGSLSRIYSLSENIPQEDIVNMEKYTGWIL